jgi:hypothetical protein
MTSESDTNRRLEYATEDYYLRVDFGQYDSVLKGVSCYQLVNKDTGVIEGESFTLPDSIIGLMNRQRWLDDARQAWVTGIVETPSFEASSDPTLIH